MVFGGRQKCRSFFLKKIFTLKPALLLTFRRFSKNNRKKTCVKVCSYQHCAYLYNMNDNKNTEIMKETLTLDKRLVEALTNRAEQDRKSITELLWDLLEDSEEDGRSEDELMEFWKSQN